MAAIIDALYHWLWEADQWFPADTETRRPSPHVSMPPPSGDVAQTPEPKSTGLASVFKSLTGSKSKNPISPAALAQHLNTSNTLKNTVYGGPPDYAQLYAQLKVANPLSERLAAAETLRHAVQDYPLSEVISIFKEGKDLIDPTKPAEARIAGFELLTACVRYGSSTDPERLSFFLVLTGPANPEDFHLQLASLVELTRHGKDLSGFHYETIPLLTSWLRASFAAATHARKLAGKKRPKDSLLGEETNLMLLFDFIVDIIKFLNASEEGSTGDLLDAIFYICGHTISPKELKACLEVIDATITYGEIPQGKMLACVKMLCSIHLFEDVQHEAWRSISNLCKSHNGHGIVRMLLDFLRNPLPPGPSHVPKNVNRILHGTLRLLRKLFIKDGKKGYPLVPFTLLMDALINLVAVESVQVDLSVLELVLCLISGENQKVMDNVMEENWSTMFDVILTCSQQAVQALDSGPTRSHAQTDALQAEGEAARNRAINIGKSLQRIIVRIGELVGDSSIPDFFQKEDCIAFLVKVHASLPKECAMSVIDYYMEYRYCYPSSLDWEKNYTMILEAFFTNRQQPQEVRLEALKAVTDVFEVVEMMDKHDDPDCYRNFVTGILDKIGEERDVAVLGEVIEFGVSVAETADESMFNYVVNAIQSCITSDQLQSHLGSPPTSRPTSTQSNRASQTPSDVATKGMVQIFMRVMDKSTTKTLRVYDELLWIVKSHECETDARISALKLLCRMRADWANRLFLTPFTESDELAATLYRTPSSLARKQATDEASQQGRSSRMEESGRGRMERSASFGQNNPSGGRQAVRSASGINRAIIKHYQMWTYPDGNALPEPVSPKASSLLSSFVGTEEDGRGMLIQSGRTPLNIASYLGTLIELMQQGCDWEIYSFVLVHLVSQLTNHALFKGAIFQIRSLRTLLCDQIKNNTYHEPPLSSGLRKADVAVCLFRLLTMVLSYHDHFSKIEEDEIVRTFLQGIGADRGAKCCIHALSICCHEIPASTSKALVTILQKMSQSITQSHVAVHILEFLACLSRMPNLYVNFREEEYRTVFMMCFRYLQYVRDQSPKESVGRNSLPPTRQSSMPSEAIADQNTQPNTVDDLPQYVYALAYHVIIFWFLSLKLPDRAVQVSWITKNLISTDVNGKEKIDEQAQVTLDFMQRVAFADVDESAADTTFTADRFGEISKKRWIVGQSIVTVEQATRGGWAQITKRQPSGTSCYMIREKFTRPPPHQDHVFTDAARTMRHLDDNVVLPSHLLVQLIGSIPQTKDSMRPIALPNDDMINRAIKTFDRNSTVDGHKVGVIYIGENQTQEVEILANVMGSSDYTEFLSGLGTLTKLKGATFNTQGLDREYDTDGAYAFCWRDRVTEIVFHVTTQMPTNLDHDPQCINKKKHIGNDFVNIIFNNSGLPFRFDTFASQFNYVNIVITPESRASFVATRLRSQKNGFYKVQVMSKPGFPEISPASETKIISLAALPGFIRLLALNASVFSLVWDNKEGGEHVSSWRNRLREIVKLRERHSNKTPPPSAPGTSNGLNVESKPIRDSLNSLRRTSVANFLSTSTAEPNSQRSSVLSTAETEVGPGTAEESMIDGLDFSKWS